MGGAVYVVKYTLKREKNASTRWNKIWAGRKIWVPGNRNKNNLNNSTTLFAGVGTGSTLLAILDKDTFLLRRLPSWLLWSINSFYRVQDSYYIIDGLVS